MRITNKMMTNNALYNINNNKNLMNTLEQQYSTGKKITRPSDDPIVAVRALKFRTNLSELTQYTDKNIPDAFNWMEVTERALDSVNEILRSMNTYCNQSANDYETADDRNAIVTNLKQLKEQLYQEGNTNYAGRYVFSGYKTDTSLVFNEATTDLHYEITEPLTGKDVEIISTVIGGIDLEKYDPNHPENWDDTMPSKVSAYRLRLSYDNLKDDRITFSYTAADGTQVTNTPVNTVSVNDADAYQPEAGQINFIPETGELIIGDALYDSLRTATSITVGYDKDSFQQNDLRPEHYFDCTKLDLSDPAAETITYTKSDQQMQYEVNFNQKLTINTQGSEAFTTNINRMITEISDAVDAVNRVEDSIREVDRMLEDTSISKEQREKLEGIKEQLNSEFAIKTAMMTEAMQRGLQITEEEQDTVNIAVADLGGRYKRLQLTESRLSDQKVDFEDLLSSNEDADLVDTIIKYMSAQTVYNSSLSAASKLVQTSLLDFL